MHPYDYVPAADTQVACLETKPGYSLYRVDFTSVPPPAGGGALWGEYYQPRRNPCPLVILTHGLADSSAIPCRLFARRLAEQGIASLNLVHLFHSSRIPAELRGRFPSLTPQEWFEGYRVAVTDIRRVTDWASTRQELDKKRIGVVGISFGGFISALAMGVDARIKAGVFIVSGGNSPKMVRLGRSQAYGAKNKRDLGELMEFERSYNHYLAEVAMNGVANVTPARPSFLTDPMTFAGALRERPLLMINARWDKYIPREAAIDFWQACGKPAITWLPAGHVSIWLWYPVIQRRVAGFLASTLIPGESRAQKG